MGTITKVISGMGILIAIYLFLSNYTATTKVISQLGSTTVGVTKALQGR